MDKMMSEVVGISVDRFKVLMGELIDKVSEDMRFKDKMSKADIIEIIVEMPISNKEMVLMAMYMGWAEGRKGVATELEQIIKLMEGFDGKKA